MAGRGKTQNQRTKESRMTELWREKERKRGGRAWWMASGEWGMKMVNWRSRMVGQVEFDIKNKKKNVPPERLLCDQIWLVTDRPLVPCDNPSLFGPCPSCLWPSLASLPFPCAALPYPLVPEMCFYSKSLGTTLTPISSQLSKTIKKAVMSSWRLSHIHSYTCLLSTLALRATMSLTIIVISSIALLYFSG